MGPDIEDRESIQGEVGWMAGDKEGDDKGGSISRSHGTCV